MASPDPGSPHTRILCVDDDAQVLALIATTLRRDGHEVLTAPNAGEALHRVSAGDIDLVISDYQMPGITGLELLGMLRAEGHDVPLIMLTGHASIDHAVEAMRAGATDYLAKPFGREHLQLAIDRALEVGRLRRENDALRREIMQERGRRRLIGTSAAMREVQQLIERAAASRATVLLQGESGTGKELVARAIHEASDRRDRAFITLNCAALPPGLIESALFGHERGAFTGALKRAHGAFERAHGGTLLLDEITEMRLDLQPRLLRVLQEQEFERLGGDAPIRVDVRVIATSNRDITREVAAGRFRQDLFYRINVLTMTLPPLRERAEDIPALAMRFAASTAEELRKPFEGFSPAAMEALEGYGWPGNVRELQHAVERAVILGDAPTLEPHLFPDQWTGTPAPADGGGPTADGPRITLTDFNLAQAQALLIQRALAAAGNNRTRAAELLGITDRTLRKKLNRKV